VEIFIELCRSRVSRAPIELGVKFRLLAIIVGATVSVAAGAAALEDDLGRSETRVRSAAYPLVTDRTSRRAGSV